MATTCCKHCFAFSGTATAYPPLGTSVPPSPATVLGAVAWLAGVDPIASEFFTADEARNAGRKGGLAVS